MQKIITTQGLTDGHYDAPDTNTAIHERIDNRLTACYRQYYGDDIHIAPALTYQVTDGQVTMIQLTYAIDNPTPERLENFREACDLFYELHSFIIETAESPRVLFRATDLYDMAMLIHALDYLSVSLESILCPVEASLTESPQVPKVRIRVTYCDGMPVEEEEDPDEMPVFDEHGVGYSADGKKLLCCRFTFRDTRYEVPDGVGEIDDFAFVACRHYLELSIPRSVHTIGDSLFGNGGIILVREE